MYTVSSNPETDPAAAADHRCRRSLADGNTTAALDEKEHKIASEWSYSIEWRNYFRKEIFPRLLKYVRT
jgi:hypothetical protein